MSLLVARGLVKGFGGVRALDGVDLEVAEGSISAVIGPNGSGKTTLLNVLSGAYRADAGSIMFAGADMAGRPPLQFARQGLARSFQNIRLFTRLSVLDNARVGAMGGHGPSLAAVLLRLAAHRTAEAMATRRARAALDQVGLGGLADAPAGSLPYAQQRLLELARAVAGRPRLLLLDEPAAGMNMTEAMALMDIVRRLRDGGITVLLVEHNMRLVMQVSDHLTVLDFGRRIAAGRPDEIRRDPAVIAAYLGPGHGEGGAPDA